MPLQCLQLDGGGIACFGAEPERYALDTKIVVINAIYIVELETLIYGDYIVFCLASHLYGTLENVYKTRIILA